MADRPRTVGILGGMGPAATVDLFHRIVQATPAHRDQDHLPILIVNDPSVPDRSQAILHGGPDPVPRMVEGLQRLARMGADFAVIPCNTAHHYLPQLRAAVAIPILDMIQETVAALARAHPQVRQVGILATQGTLSVGLYQQALEAAGRVPLVPEPAAIRELMEAIYGPEGIKARGVTPPARARLQAVGRALQARGAQALILGCTEIPLALGPGDLPVPLIASNQALAEAAVREARGGENWPPDQSSWPRSGVG